MKQTHLALFLVLALFIGSLSQAALATDSPNVHVNPATKIVKTGEAFTVDVNLDFAQNLYAYEIWLSYDHTKLEATAIDYENYLNTPSMIWHQEVNNSGGYVSLAVSSMFPAQAKTGGSPPPLATIHFTALAGGSSLLHLYKTILANNQGFSITHSATDGQITIAFLGDINSDAKVDAYDLFRLGQAYGSELGSPNWDPDADINNDNKVNQTDLQILNQNYGKP